MEESIDFIFETFEAAMDVHTKLFEIIKKNGFVTYADLYLLVNKDVDNCKEEFHRFGWANLFYVKVEPYKDKRWILKMPEMTTRNIKY